MKAFFKTTWLLFLSLFTAVVIYPFIHELGHSITSFLVGGKVEEINLFPLPKITFSTVRVSESGMVLTGLAGLMLPFFISSIVRIKNFTGWFILQLLRGITVLSFILALVALIAYRFGRIMADQDIITVVQIWPQGATYCGMILFFAAVFVLIEFIRDDPIVKIAAYFGKKV